MRDIMKRTIVAFIAGAVLATAGSVYAEDIKTLIGKQIQGEIPVKVNGETLEKNAIFVDGTSYLPVRAIGDALNMNVKYDADLGVELTPKEASKVEQTTESPVEPKPMSQDDIDAIKSAEEQISISENKIVELKSKIADLDKKIESTSDSHEKQGLELQKETTVQLLTANEDNIVSQRSFIAKIKAKYE